jgi:hypothetical protein
VARIVIFSFIQTSRRYAVYLMICIKP